MFIKKIHTLSIWEAYMGLFDLYDGQRGFWSDPWSVPDPLVVRSNLLEIQYPFGSRWKPDLTSKKNTSSKKISASWHWPGSCEKVGTVWNCNYCPCKLWTSEPKRRKLRQLWVLEGGWTLKFWSGIHTGRIDIEQIWNHQYGLYVHLAFNLCQCVQHCTTMHRTMIRMRWQW